MPFEPLEMRRNGGVSPMRPELERKRNKSIRIFVSCLSTRSGLFAGKANNCLKNSENVAKAW